MSTSNTTKPATLDDLSTQMANLAATMNEMLAILAENTSQLTDMEDKVTSLSTEVSIKADQGRHHVAVNNVYSKQGAGQQNTNGRPWELVSRSAIKAICDRGKVGTLLNANIHELRFPKYDGSNDPLPWLHRCEQFFRAARTLETENLSTLLETHQHPLRPLDAQQSPRRVVSSPP
jgi:hypothetical protein